MFNRDRWQEIFETIRKNKLRTFLSGFTVALGIFIFIILFGFGNGLKNQFQEFFLDDATNTISFFQVKLLILIMDLNLTVRSNLRTMISQILKNNFLSS